LYNFAKNATSTMVNAFTCTLGKRAFSPRTSSSKYSKGRSGCSPPTMWNSVTASVRPEPAVAHASSSAMV
jgi:hypothetical protein